MILIGLTGNIATGKSAAAQMFRERGAGIIDADVIAREVVDVGTDAWKEIVSEFGESILDSDGRIDRKKLGNLVFNDEDKRKKLNRIVHPRIRERIGELISALEAENRQAAVIEAALIIENGGWLYDAVDHIVVVTTDPGIQVGRLIERDGYTEEEALSRINSQMPAAEKLSHADYVIDNSGSLTETARQVEEIWRNIIG